METYTHKVQYYETDKMGITHHSNYIRWMEEARIDFFNQIGMSYRYLESEGIFSPVVSVECDYKASSTFEDVIEIEVQIEEFKGVKLILSYLMRKADGGEIVAKGKTSHGFVDKEGRLIVLKKSYPKMYEDLKKYLSAE